jgi:hypothetical protein
MNAHILSQQDFFQKYALCNLSPGTAKCLHNPGAVNVHQCVRRRTSRPTGYSWPMHGGLIVRIWGAGERLPLYLLQRAGRSGG